MFKSIFVKYITTFAIVILASFLVLSVIITTMINSYVLDDRRQNIEWMADTAAGIQSRDFRTYSSDMGEYAGENSERIKEMMNSMTKRMEGMIIFLTDEQGKILISSVKLSEKNLKVPEYSIRILSEKGEFSDKSTSLDGLLPENCMISASPVLSQNGNFSGAVFVCASYSGYDTLINAMEKTVFMSSLWIMLAAIIAFYFICDRTVVPLRQMVGAAKSFATGKFDTRVEVRGNDEISELAVAFNNMACSLEKTEKTRNMFLANVSHDLRTPMTTISGFIDGITSGAIPKEKHAYYLAVISEDVHRLSRLVSKLLDVSRLESGDKKFEFINFDVCELSRLILISFEKKIEEKHLDVIFDASDDRVMVHADKDSIHQVLYNLIENAIKFARVGGKFRISISETDKHKVRISVFDEGKGIPEEDLPYIFDRFYKTDKSRGRDNLGVGLGLYIVKTIRDAHGEHITVKSDEGTCEFEFHLKEAVLEPHKNDDIKAI